MSSVPIPQPMTEEAVALAQNGLDDEGRAIVSRVMGDHPAGGHDEGRPARGEAPRG